MPLVLSRLPHAVLASLLALASTYQMNIYWNTGDSTRLTALVLLGPMIMLAGTFANYLRKRSKLGWIMIVLGYNFGLGFPLLPFAPQYSSVQQWCCAHMLLLCLLPIVLNNWQILYHLDKSFCMRSQREQAVARRAALRAERQSSVQGGDGQW